MKFKNKKGFTLLEVIAVVTILGVGLVSILSLANYVVYVPEISANRMVAAALAQKKLEEVRFTRDSNWAGEGTVDWNNNVCPLNVLSETTLNGVSFTSIVSSVCSPPDIADVSVSLSWLWRGQNYTFGPLNTTLYNWKQ